MELYYAGYTVGWPVGLGETLIKATSYPRPVQQELPLAVQV